MFPKSRLYDHLVGFHIALKVKGLNRIMVNDQKIVKCKHFCFPAFPMPSLFIEKRHKKVWKYKITLYSLGRGWPTGLVGWWWVGSGVVESLFHLSVDWTFCICLWIGRHLAAIQLIWVPWIKVGDLIEKPEANKKIIWKANQLKANYLKSKSTQV